MPNSTVQRIFNAVQRVEGALLAGAILVIAGLTIANVFARGLFNTSLAFTEEVSEFMIILVCFVGLSYAASQGRHIRMTALYDQFPARIQRGVMIGVTLFTAALLFLLAWHSLHYVYVVHALGSVSPVLQVPLALVYLAAPLGLVLAGVQYLFTAYRNIVSDTVYIAYDKKDEYEEDGAPGQI